MLSGMKGLNTTTFESKGAVKNEYKTIEHVIKKKNGQKSNEPVKH